MCLSQQVQKIGLEATRYKANINIQPDSQPKFFKARPVPYAQLEAVEKELNRLETAGIIKHDFRPEVKPWFQNIDYKLWSQ